MKNDPIQHLCLSSSMLRLFHYSLILALVCDHAVSLYKVLHQPRAFNSIE
jgi:hypothetical protein